MATEPNSAVEYWLHVEALRNRKQAEAAAPGSDPQQGYHVPLEPEDR